MWFSKLRRLPIDEKAVAETVKNIERKVGSFIKSGKKEASKRTVLAVLLALSIICVVSGLVMFLSRFFSTDLILLVFGVLFLYSYLIMSSVK